MDRREAIKNISVSLGYTITAPTILNVLSSCSGKEKSLDLVFLDETQKYMIDHLVDCILPISETPGGLDVQLSHFIDIMIRKTKTKKEQALFDKGSRAFTNSFQKIYKKPPLEGSREEFRALLDVYFNISRDKQDAIFEELDHTSIIILEGKSKTVLIYNFLVEIRNYCLLGYYTSQLIVENVMNQDSFTNGYLGCVNE
ncbi:gluconate 2-dehydrogenase subunit 3 family protein [Aquimarina sp. 2201CG5-10]|uniref:gluconate 2-dehydrogenase subunit 3 family protein n=1 Tax=Aquimarina callyspongiae TaxID=3098150 RepID=UPI002AB47F6B|nr:gluconate 2-dehydrogenase subunit 3 family protein [Aquimarina sp. 2201CG5-10]MDY8134177.1 gluconate 2-dehydrogenase subunit 3 family protein [Aquimarina sp. 2201CG5-10]